MSDYDEESDRTEDEDEDIGQTENHRSILIPAKQWIRTVIRDRKTLAEGAAQKAKLTEADVDDFLERFPTITQKMSGKTPTILHAIFDMVQDEEQDADIDSATVKVLVQRLARQATHLLCVTNRDSPNPLYLAIVKKKSLKYMADYMVADFPPEDPNRQHLVDALQDCRGNERRKSCLHLAFQKALKPALLERIIKTASATSLEAVDNTGRRPMHYAVQYKRCNVEVIRAFLAKDDESRDLQSSSAKGQPTKTFLDVDDNAKISVYREHLLSAKAHEEEHILRRETSHRKERPENHDDKQKDVWGRWDEMAGGRGAASQAKPELEQQYGLGNKSAAYPGQAFPSALGDMPDVIEDDAMIAREEIREVKRRLEAKTQPGNEEMNSNRQGFGPLGGRDALPIQTTSPSAPTTKQSDGIAAKNSNVLKRTPTMVYKNTRSKVDTKPKRMNTTKGVNGVKRSNTVAKKPPKTFDHDSAARVSKTVLRLLKLHYMRTRSIEKATWWLYETNPEDVQTFFDYRGLPSEIHEQLFKTAFEKAKFDEVLSSVHFPHVTVTWRKTPQGQRPVGGPSRQDMKLFFNFLYKSGVRYILKVVVEEGAQSAHSDDAIKEVLGPIAVEHLDWRKVDMDPELICGVSSQAEDLLDGPKVEINPRNQIRKLDLQWSGNNAALRAWSELEGLALLPHLEIVNIVIPKDVVLHDSAEWMDRKKKEFEERLNKHRLAVSDRLNKRRLAVSDHLNKPSLAVSDRQKVDQLPPTPVPYNLEVTVNLRTPSLGTEKKPALTLLRAGPTQGRSSAAAPEQDINEHEWLKCTDSFATCLKRVWDYTLRQYSSTTNQSVTGAVSDHDTAPKPTIGSGLEGEVIVALIDDGVSLLDQMLAGRVLEGKTFDYGDGGIIGQSYNSAQGHGTEMARCILRVCPMAKIYPIRLKTHLVNGRSQIVLKSAALAINAALEKNATVISMSWTIPVPTHSSPEKVMFEDAMRKAASRNVLMFCSSPDEGKFQTKYYPSATQPDKVFRIGAAYDDGGAFRYAGKDVDFIFPGVEVSNTKTSATGSSIATALAAGLAATIIYCFKISALAVRAHSQARSNDIWPPTFTASAVRKLSEHDVMKTAFSNIGRVNEEKFIQIWDELRPAVVELDDPKKPDDQKLHRIMKLCSNLRVL